jgi:hypothetical protein
MESTKLKQITVFLFVATFLISCSKNENPVVDGKEKQMNLEIITSDQVKITWDSTIYQHNTDWAASLDTLAADSLATLLKNSDLSIEELWYPNVITFCEIPIRRGSEVIIKLSKSDTLIYNYGFLDNDGGFPINCFDYWRHYKYTYE